MGRLKHYRNCEVVIAPEKGPLKYTVGCEDEMVHQELKCCNAHNELGKQNNGKRFLTDREIKALVEQFVKDDDIIDEIRAIDLTNMTPFEAMNKLYEIQNKIKNRW